MANVEIASVSFRASKPSELHAPYVLFGEESRCQYANGGGEKSSQYGRDSKKKPAYVGAGHSAMDVVYVPGGGYLIERSGSPQPDRQMYRRSPSRQPMVLQSRGARRCSSRWRWR